MSGVCRYDVFCIRPVVPLFTDVAVVSLDSFIAVRAVGRMVSEPVRGTILVHASDGRDVADRPAGNGNVFRADDLGRAVESIRVG